MCANAIAIPLQHDNVTLSPSRRPDWGRCEAYIDGGTERWSELSQGRSSDQLVDVLLAQIAGVDVSEIAKEDTFQGQVCIRACACQ